MGVLFGGDSSLIAGEVWEWHCGPAPRTLPNADESTPELALPFVPCWPGNPATPLVPSSPHDARKNRYISFVPNNGSRTVAFEVIVPPCRRGRVGEPELVDFAGVDPAYVSYIVDEPVYRIWPEAVVHVRGCVIAPQQQYELRAP